MDQPDFVLINALSTALRLEEKLMENKYFEGIETDNAKTNFSPAGSKHSGTLPKNPQTLAGA
ncbi:MAG: hypothetical protein ACYS6K_06110 [Planctomycetota bacterium]|jgi:hypothetical protein